MFKVTCSDGHWALWIQRRFEDIGKFKVTGHNPYEDGSFVFYFMDEHVSDYSTVISEEYKKKMSGVRTAPETPK